MPFADLPPSRPVPDAQVTQIPFTMSARKSGRVAASAVTEELRPLEHRANLSIPLREAGVHTQSVWSLKRTVIDSQDGGTGEDCSHQHTGITQSPGSGANPGTGRGPRVSTTNTVLTVPGLLATDQALNSKATCTCGRVSSSCEGSPHSQMSRRKQVNRHHLTLGADGGHSPIVVLEPEHWDHLESFKNTLRDSSLICPRHGLDMCHFKSSPVGATNHRTSSRCKWTQT